MVGKVIKEVAEAALKESDKAARPTIKITEDVRAPPDRDWETIEAEMYKKDNNGNLLL